jgi:hypothetical protein
VPTRPLTALALALLGVALPVPGALAARDSRPAPTAHTELVLDHGHVRVVHDRLLPAPGAEQPPAARRRASSRPPAPSRGGPARAAATRGPSVPAAVLGLQSSGAISPSDAQRYLADYSAARASLRRLRGTRRLELGAVLANVRAIAAARGFTATRLPALFLTLERNRQWWTTGPLLSGAQRVGFPGSQLVWQYYPGQGIEIQWLGTFGKANGQFESGHNDANLRALLNEAIPLAAQRAGGIAWEYLFQFDGGLPPWTSGLSQGTAVQALARAWSRFGTASYLTAAHQALGVFQTPPPAGVQVSTASGAHYLEYTYAPRERILNGFIQSLVGLYDFASLTGDSLARQLFVAGDAEGRIETPRYDTGAWSLYDQSFESDLSYHELLRDFLRNLCQRTQKNPLLSPAPGPAPSPGGTSSTGGTGARRAAAVSANPDAIYCTTADHFTGYLTTRPVLTLLTSRVAAAGTARVRFSLSKISTVALTLRRGGRIAYGASAEVGHGTPGFAWPAPRRAGAYAVTLQAVDLAGNRGSAAGSITVTAPARRHRPPAKRAARSR